MRKYLYPLLFLFSTLFAQEEQQSFWETYTAALRGDKIAQFQTGVIYERGIGIEANDSKAALWYEKSAWQGYMDAQYNLALMYASGRGVEKNIDRAMIWLAKAARQGDREARELLLKIIDGKVDEKSKTSPLKPMGEKSDEIETILPVTLITKEGAQVCTTKGICTAYNAKTTMTSKSKRGNYYKISGMVTRAGWQPFESDGWIEESSVVIRR